MNTFYVDGKRVSHDVAVHFFAAFTPARYELRSDELPELWESCQTSEEQRDIYLPDGLEIVQA